MRELVRRTVPPSKSALVVDVGCGTGGNIAALAGEYKCVGVDPSREAVDFARRRFREVEFICGEAPRALEPFKDHARLILLMDVLEHIRDDREFFSQVVATIKTGTRLLITVPADESLWSEHDLSFGHFRRYDLSSLRALWADLPVTTIMASYYNARLYPIIKLIRFITRRRGRALGRAGTDFTLLAAPVNRALLNVFAGEAKVLAKLQEGTRTRGYTYGVGLIAVLRRE